MADILRQTLSLLHVYQYDMCYIYVKYFYIQYTSIYR